jgi:hypothetical protein
MPRWWPLLTRVLTDVMTEHQCELLQMDIVGPARVRSAGGKWYILVVVHDYSRQVLLMFRTLLMRGWIFAKLLNFILASPIGCELGYLADDVITKLWSI